MRVVPVIDLAGGIAVHAVRGERAGYAPVRSVLAPSADPLALADGLGSLGARRLYVADLDAIGGDALQRDVLRALARRHRILVDAGASDASRVRELLELGAEGVVVGTETLGRAEDLAALAAEAPGARLTLSLDLREGRAIARDPALAGLPAPEALARLRPAAPPEVIVLDLARVGSGQGPDVELLAALRARFPELELLAGGGVRHVADLRALAGAGAAGALVGTALHTGAIGAAELRALAQDAASR